MATIFLSYKREAGTEQKRRDEMKKMMEDHYKGRHRVVFDESEFVAGKGWRTQIFKSISKSDCVVVLWSKFSEWVFMEAAFAEFHGMPIIFVCYGDERPPSPFNHEQHIILPYGIQGTDLVNVMNKLFEALNQILETESSTQEVIQQFSESVFRTAFYEELSKPGLERKDRFEKPFLLGLESGHELQLMQLKLVNELLDHPFDEIPVNYPYGPYKLRYDLGKYLGELNGLRDNVRTLSNPITGPHGTFQAMQYLVTQTLFHEYLVGFQTATSLTLPNTENYLPYVLNPLDTKNIDKLIGFVVWVKDKYFSEFKEVRLPTESEWLILANPVDQWDSNKLKQCNLLTLENSDPEIAAVGVFRGSKSHSGCYDLIGNVWELCTLHPGDTDPQRLRIAGWSIRDGDDEVIDNVLRTSPLRGTEGFPIGFRLVVTR